MKIKNLLEGSEKDSNRICARRPLIAALLSICPGLGQQYSGHLFRGISLYMIIVVMFWISAVGFMYVTSTVLSFFVLLVPLVAMLLIMIDAVISSIKQGKKYRLKWFNSVWIYIVVFGGLLATVNPLMDNMIGKYIVRAYFVTSESMCPQILKHDLIVINKLKEPKRGDVVLIGHNSERSEASISRIIKDKTLRRIIAVPGDKIEIRGRKVIINNSELNEPYVTYGDGISVDILNDETFSFGPDEVPENEYFVLSDARQYSFDSRVFGYIDKGKITGVATKVFWSWNFKEGRVKWERTAMNIY
jgi:signal peptidase I